MNAETSFLLEGGGQPIVLIPTYVNGKGPFKFMLNTGAALSLLSLETARQLGINKVEPQVATGIGGNVKLALGSVSALTVGDQTLPDLEVAVTDGLRRIETIVGAKIDGAIGYNFLRRFCVTLDYPQRIVILAAVVAESENPKLGVQTRFNIGSETSPVIVLPVLVNDTGPYRFGFDTGCSTTFISPELAQQLRVNRVAGPGITGAGGKMPATGGTVESMAIEGAMIRNLHVRVTDAVPQLGEALGEKLYGIVGYNYLKCFRVTIDYPNQTLQLA